MVAVHQEPFRIVGGFEAVGRQYDLAVVHRFHQIWRNHDHQFGFVATISVRLEQRPQDRNVGEPGCLVDGRVVAVLHQAGDHEAFARAQFDGSFRPPGGYCRNAEAIQNDRAVGRDFRNFRRYADRNPAIGQHGWRVGKADTEILVLDRNFTQTGRHRDGEFTACKEGRRLTRNGCQIGRGQSADQTDPLRNVECGCNVETEEATGRLNGVKAGIALIVVERGPTRCDELAGRRVERQ